MCQGFLSQLSLFDIVAKEKETIVFELIGTKVGKKIVRFSLFEMVGSLLTRCMIFLDLSV
jgi:hypothetical protein